MTFYEQVYYNHHTHHVYDPLPESFVLQIIAKIGPERTKYIERRAKARMYREGRMLIIGFVTSRRF